MIHEELFSEGRIQGRRELLQNFADTLSTAGPALLIEQVARLAIKEVFCFPEKGWFPNMTGVQKATRDITEAARKAAADYDLDYSKLARALAFTTIDINEGHRQRLQENSQRS